MALYKGSQKISPILLAGEPTLTSKTITANGTYSASSDNADGYSSVIVDVASIGLPREVTAQGVYRTPSESFTFSLPNNVITLGDYALSYAFSGSGLTSADLSSLTTINGRRALEGAFEACYSLVSVDLGSLTSVNGSYALSDAFANSVLASVDLSSLTTISGSYAFSGAFLMDSSRLTSIDLSSLTTISGNYVFRDAFNFCGNLTSVDLSSLTTINGSYTFYGAFDTCTSLTTLSFPALTSTSFGSYTNQFDEMLRSVMGCTVHFPSNLQSVIGSWSSVTNGFGGTNTTVLFDLPATT